MLCSHQGAKRYRTLDLKVTRPQLKMPSQCVQYHQTSQTKWFKTNRHNQVITIPIDTHAFHILSEQITNFLQIDITNPF